MRVGVSLQCHNRSANEKRKPNSHKTQTVKLWNCKDRKFKVPFDFDKNPQTIRLQPEPLLCTEVSLKKSGLFKKVPVIG